MPPTTPTALLITERLGRDVVDLIAEKRAAGLSWRRIALVIRDDTGIDVTHETVRAWAAAPADSPAVASCSSDGAVISATFTDHVSP